ncbi:glycerol-3-phosphate dehydrogenase [Desulfotomaculum arcticum]|uniref:Glycerol-3-phosphate dehydrogenase n=1 Tax=Desulfotruncus arcticus DSM 17038 TaxID=1121424 RepID=A0A1I2WTJ6_9FIRM|nr:glycerol-3-phosphate dehydrogenase/oxidase [Desulfotruncus arcticus]SFH04654.1 glycerol-3-phosphate dehydrogenase [Desulfotomaculum arcticum] [Desulfotruncus arcticus DSM 17038]
MLEREQIIARLGQPWDVIVIGGGITGAGVLREAAGRGLRCLLLEQRDFAWGTSSRSGKLVHGGLRYLKQGQVKTTWHSVRERDKLLRDRAGLVEPVGFLVPTYRDRPLDPFLIGAGLTIYDLMAGRRSRRRYKPGEIALITPGLNNQGLTGGLWYLDARTDDARLVLRVILEGVELGGTALNYARVVKLLQNAAGYVRGAAVKDMVSGREIEVAGQVVVNAAGIWSGEIGARVCKTPVLRPLRGSHLVFPRWRFPLAQAVSFPHPEDSRPVYLLPWEGATLLGTTDIDHQLALEREPFISCAEGRYLLAGVRKMFPSLNLTASDVLSTFSGVRPVVGTGQKDPSKESRDHVVRAEKGLVTVTGGKLTTFRLLARDALAQAGKWLKSAPGIPPAQGPGKSLNQDLALLAEQLGGKRALRLAGRYGRAALPLARDAAAGELDPVPGTETMWAELGWAARHEGVVHLEDLLLRRVRLGNVTVEGGSPLLGQLRRVAQLALGWDDAKWQAEVRQYLKLWDQAYSPRLISLTAAKTPASKGGVKRR